jgi:DNA-directed RNA polymerase specialized sigma24 family protein
VLEPLDDIVADPLVMGVVRGDRAAWFQLTLYIEQWVESHVPRHWRMRKARLSGSVDDVRDVLLETLERVDRDDFRALRLYLERKLQAVPDVRSAVDTAPERRAAAGALPEPLTFVAWLAGVVDFSIREHVRKRYGRAPAGRRDQDDDAPLPALTKRSLQSWAVHPSAGGTGQFGSANAGLSRVLTARSILSYAAETFDAPALSLFRRYLEQASFEELADEFGLPGADAARAEVRKLKERLRVRFRDAP